MTTTDDDGEDQNEQHHMSTLEEQEQTLINRKKQGKISTLDPEIERLYNLDALKTSDGKIIVWVDKYGEPYTDKDKKLMHIPCVAVSKKEVQRKFDNYVFGLVTLNMGNTWLFVYLSIYYTVMPIVTRDYPWLFIVIGILLGILGLVYWFEVFEEWNLPHQIFGMILTNVIITVGVCFLTLYLDTNVFLQSVMLTGIIMATLYLFTWYPKFGYSSIGLNIYTFIFIVILGFALVYWPFRDYWSHPSDLLSYRPQELQDALLSLIFTFVFCFLILASMTEQRKKLRPFQFIFAAWNLYIEIALLFVALGRLSCKCNVYRSVGASSTAGQSLMSGSNLSAAAARVL